MSGLGAVVHACRPSYSKVDCGSRPAQAKSERDPHLNKAMHGVCAYHLSYVGTIEGSQSEASS
jgi:hypothetical protein